MWYMPITFSHHVGFRLQLNIVLFLKLHTKPLGITIFLKTNSVLHTVAQISICNVGLCFINKRHGLATALDQEMLKFSK